MFIDTSAIVALLAGAPDAYRLANRLSTARTRLTSGPVILEASMRLSTLLDLDPVLVETRVQAPIDEAGLSVIAIDAGIAKEAVAAFDIREGPRTSRATQSRRLHVLRLRPNSSGPPALQGS